MAAGGGGWAPYAGARALVAWARENIRLIEGDLLLAGTDWRRLSGDQLLSVVFTLLSRKIGHKDLMLQLDEIETKALLDSPEGVDKLRETWGMTPEAIAGVQAAESMRPTG